MACVNVCVGLLWKSAPERRWGPEGGKKIRKNTRKRNVPTNLPGQRVLVGKGRVTQQTGFQDFQCDCAFLYRERSLYRKLNHVRRRAHVVVSSSAEVEKSRQSLS